ncbi:MAG: hypothetical protein ACRETQ_08625 [Gammaproteobacteria bacterium]
MSRLRLLAWLPAVFVATVSGFVTLAAQARPPVSVHVGIGVRYPGPVSGWARGYWHRGYYGPRFGWWWVVGPSWYYYPAPIYPYPNPYVPPVVVQTAPAQPGPAPVQYWYYCPTSKAYYPYVTECSTTWQPVPVTPPSVGGQPGGSR